MAGRKAPRSLNEQLLDDLLRHASLLPQFEDEQLRRLVRILDQAHDEIGAEISARLKRLLGEGVPLVEDRHLAGLRNLLRKVKALLVAAYRRVGRRLTRELKLFAIEEADFFRRSLERLSDATGGLVSIQGLAAELVEAIVAEDPLGVRPLKAWVEKLAEDELARIRNAIEVGLMRGEGMQAIVRRIYGTKGEPKRGTAILTSRRDLETMVRTAVQNVSARVQMETLAANADVVKAVRWLATLDSDTCELCMARDGHLYDPHTFEPIDPKTFEPVPADEVAADPGKWPPWGAGPAAIHPRCRCVPNLVTKSLRELGIDLDEVPVVGQRAATTPGQLVNGSVPASTTYPEWLRTQPRYIVERILGETRARLFLEGRLEFSKLFESTGEFLTLDELRERFGVFLGAA